MAAADVVHFDDYRLDMSNAQLWRGQELVKLAPKALNVLDYLVNRPGQLVTKDELFAAVWPEVVVSEGAMAKCIHEVRRALGETAQAPRYVETVHRLGHRFIGQVKETAVSSDSSGSSGPAVRQFGVERPPGLPLPDRPSIAVLPFTNMSGDPEQEIPDEVAMLSDHSHLIWNPFLRLPIIVLPRPF